jgi:hypothetical protein
VRDPIEHGVGERRDTDNIYQRSTGTWLVIRNSPA